MATVVINKLRSLTQGERRFYLKKTFYKNEIQTLALIC